MKLLITGVSAFVGSSLAHAHYLRAESLDWDIYGRGNFIAAPAMLGHFW
jgi:hypothetical protein